MDRLFLDANVLFSAGYGSAGIRRFWTLQKEGGCCLLVSQYVMEETRRNLDQSEQRARLEELLGQVEVIPEPSAGLTCPIELPDKDQPVFLAASVGRATHLITGDIQHFGSFFGQTILGVMIITPAEYLSSKRRLYSC